MRSIATRGLGPVRKAWHDLARITPEILAGYTKPLRADDWDVGLWERTASSRPLGLDRRLSDLTLPTLVITGYDDRIVPTADSVRLGGRSHPSDDRASSGA